MYAYVTIMIAATAVGGAAAAAARLLAPSTGPPESGCDVKRDVTKPKQSRIGWRMLPLCWLSQMITCYVVSFNKKTILSFPTDK